MLEDTTALRQTYLRLTGSVLPAEATSEWPVSEDHCFQRIVLDNLVGDVWYEEIPGRPAVRSLTAEQLRAAIALAESMQGDPERVAELNRRSLHHREAL
jgi:hypothetical protein